MDFSTERKIIGGFITLLGILVLLGLYSFYNNQKSEEANASVLHTNDILLHLGQVRNSLFDFETSQSVFVVTKDPKSAQRNSEARTEIANTLITIRKLTSNNPLQLARLDTLSTLLRLKATYADTLLGIYRRSNALTYSKTQELHYRGLLLTERMKQVITRFRLMERTLREEKSKSYDSYLILVKRMIVSLFLLALFVLVFVFYAFHYTLKIRQRQENIIKQNAHTMQSILDNASAYISIKDLQGRYTFVNKRFEFDTHHTKESFLGKTDTDLFSEETGKRTKETDEKVIQEGLEIQYTSSVQLKDGKHHYFVIKFPLRDVDDKVFAVCAMSTDITERVKLEEENKKASEKVYDLYNNAPCGYHSVDAEGIVLDINDKLLKWLELTREEVIGKLKFCTLVSNEQQAFYLKKIEKKSMNSVELWLTRKSGETFPILLNTEPIFDDNKNFLRSRTIVFDNSERKRQEDQIKQLNLDLEINNMLLKNTNSELESFSYSVSHDLRAPLRSINGYSRILLEDYHAQLDEDGKHYIEVIMKNAQKMGTLIDDLLDFSRMGRQELKKTKTDILQLLEAVLQEIPAHKATINIENMPLAVKADNNLLRQVWSNLILNAIKYSGPKEFPLIEIGHRAELMEDIFYVKDNGVGFDMQYAHKLFGVFQRLHRMEEFEGTGVGLAFVQRIIAKHGGKVWAESVLGEGAIFYFSLPRLELYAD